MGYRLLGPPEVVRDGEPVEVGRYKLRALLAVLLLHADEVVSTDRLIGQIWLVPGAEATVRSACR